MSSAADVLGFIGEGISEMFEGRETHLQLEGVHVAVLIGFSECGEPLVDFAGNPVGRAVPAKPLAGMEAAQIGAELAVMFVAGDPMQPVIMGPLVRPQNPPIVRPEALVEADGMPEQMVIVGKEEVVLRCGKASITLTKAGKIILRGTYISSRSSGVNRIKGGSVQIN